MEKTVILTYQNGTVCSVLRVKNHDGNFGMALMDAEHDWNTTEEGLETDFDTFVEKHLAEHGYEVSRNEDFETYTTGL